MSLMAAILMSWINLPFRLLYIFRLISARLWIHLATATHIISLFFLVLYAHLVGLSASCQRALVVYSLFVIPPLLVGRISTHNRLLFAMVIQILVFPIGFLSVASILSWGAYLFVLSCYYRMLGAQHIGERCMMLVETQLKLMILSFSWINELSLMALLCNLFMAPFFPSFF